jgi:putative addiction module killer protein
VALRIARIETGNLGDHKSVGGGVSELRIFIGKGYRIYYTIRDRKLVLLLCGGDKGSQSRDIEEARQLAKGMPE